MLENILKLDGVVALTKEQQKKVKGGVRVRNVEETGEIREYNGGVYACWCTWEAKNNWFSKWKSVEGPCPGSLRTNCVE